MHGRSLMTIDPRIPTMPGRSASGFHRPGRHRVHQARSAVRGSADRMKGELLPTKIYFVKRTSARGLIIYPGCPRVMIRSGRKVLKKSPRSSRVGPGGVQNLSRVGWCRVVSCRVGPGRAGSCRVVSGRVGSCRVVSCRVVSGRVVSCRVVSCRVVPCRFVCLFVCLFYFGASQQRVSPCRPSPRLRLLLPFRVAAACLTLPRGRYGHPSVDSSALLWCRCRSREHSRAWAQLGNKGEGWRQPLLCRNS